jgi:hypothetical protein
MSLDAVSRAITAHKSPYKFNASSAEDERIALRRMGLTLFWGAAVFVLSLVALALNKKIWHNDLAEVLGLVTLIAGVLLSTYAVLSPTWRRSSNPGHAPPADGAVEAQAGAPRTSPKGLPAPPSSVTEQTTSTLDTEGASAPSTGSKSHKGAQIKSQQQ